MNDEQIIEMLAKIKTRCEVDPNCWDCPLAKLPTTINGKVQCYINYIAGRLTLRPSEWNMDEIAKIVKEGSV